MRPPVASERALRQRPHRASRHAAGFTLIELLVAISLLAVIALLSWRGLDQIVRARTTLTAYMRDERALVLTFDQIGSDALHAASDDEALGLAVSLADGGLRIVRRVQMPGSAPRLQVVNYRVRDHVLRREVSGALATVGELRRALSNGEPAASVPLLGAVNGFDVRLWVPTKGWRANNAEARTMREQAAMNLANPLFGSAPPGPSVTGIEVVLAQAGTPGSSRRVYLVGE